MTEKKSDALSQEQVQALILAACAATPTSVEQLQVFADWAKDALISATLVNLAIKGEFKVDVTNPDPNEWVWSARTP